MLRAGPCTVPRRPPRGTRLPSAVAVVLAASLAVHARGEEPPATPITAEIVARVGDVPIQRAAIDTVIARVGPEQAATPERRRQLEAGVLAQLVDEQLMRAELAHRLVEVSDAEVDAAFDRFRSQFGSPAAYQAFLASARRDEAGIREQLRLERALEKYVQPLLTPAAIDAMYQEQRRDVDGTRLRVSHVLIRPDVIDAAGLDRKVAEADSIRREILAGRLTFDDAARRHSAGPSRHRGGDLGWINRDGPMAEEFTKPVFALAKGEISKPLVTTFGVHLVKVTEVQPGRMGLDAVRPRLEKTLAAKFVRELVAAARARISVTYVPGVPHFDPAAPVEDGPLRKIIVEDGKQPAPPAAVEP